MSNYLLISSLHGKQLRFDAYQENKYDNHVLQCHSQQKYSYKDTIFNLNFQNSWFNFPFSLPQTLPIFLDLNYHLMT